MIRIPQEQQSGTTDQDNLSKPTVFFGAGSRFKIFFLEDVNWKIKMRGKAPNST